MARSMTFLGFILLISALGNVVCQVDYVPNDEARLSQQPQTSALTQEGVDVNCLFCKLLAEQVQTYVESAVNVTEAAALNFTASECLVLADKLHLPELICSEISPLIKSALDSFEGSIVEFFDPDTVCTAIKLCDEDGQLSMNQRILFDEISLSNYQRLTSLRSTYYDSIECDLCHAVIDAIKQNLSAYDTGVAHEIAGKVNSTCLDFITEFQIPITACDEIYDALVIIIMGLEVDLADFLSDNVCILAGICSQEKDHPENDSNLYFQRVDTQSLTNNADEEESVQCLLCQALAENVQEYVETEANATEASALNYTSAECLQLVSRFHLPSITCSLILPEIKEKLDDFKGSLVDFFAPDSLCTLIKLCSENNTLIVRQEETSLQTLPSRADRNGLIQLGGSATCVLCEVVVDAIVKNISAYGDEAIDEALSDVNSYCSNVVSSLDLPPSICDDVTDAVRIIFVTYSGDISSFFTSSLCPLIGACSQDSDMVSARHLSDLRSNRGDLALPRERSRGPDTQVAASNESEETCTICRALAGQIQNYILQFPQLTQSDILRYFMKSCENTVELVHEEENICPMLQTIFSGALSGSEGDLAKAFEPNALCSRISFCKESSSQNAEVKLNHVAQPGLSSNDDGDNESGIGGLIPCTLCELVVDSVDSDLSSYENQTITDIMTHTESLCASVATTLRLPVAEFCADINDAVSKVLLSVEDKLDNFVTKNLCTVVGLCPDTPSPTPGPEPASPSGPESSPDTPESPPVQPETPDETDGAPALARHQFFLGWAMAAALISFFILH